MANANPSPVIQPNLPFTTWFAPTIYDPTNPNPAPGAVYVPNVNDLIIDYTQGYFRVTAVDYTTGISTRVPWTLPLTPGITDTNDILMGAGPGTLADSYRCYVNQAVKPAILALDRRLRYYGSTTTSVKIFIGTDISSAGQVTSKFYDQNWTLLGENIPLELVAMNDTTNTAIKAPKVGYTTDILNDGELLTVVAYDAVGTVVSTGKVLVQNTSFIRSADASTRYIKAISLATPFLNPSDPTNIQYPINMPVSALNLMGVITYSDGSTSTLPVDGTKFALSGLDGYIATQQGQTVPLVLKYYLSANEFNYIGTPSVNRIITEEYSATTLPTDGAYSIKLFGYPVWQDPINGYRMEYYLYNLDRKNVYLVTPLVQLDTGSAPFNPTLYGTYQTIGVAVNLNAVDPSFAAYRHVQTLGISLLRPGNDASGDNWTVAYTPGQTPAYGVGVLARGHYVQVNNWTLDLTCGVTTTLSDWLNKVYYPSQPLFDGRTETQAPAPNIMALYVAGTRYEYPIAQWNTLFTVTQTLLEGTDVYIEWILRDAQNDLQLGVSGFIIHLS